MDNTIDVLEQLNYTSDFWIILLPFIVMLLDVTTGFINAWAKKQIKSSVMRQGLARKFGELVVIAIGQTFFYAIRLPEYCVVFISFYIVLMELISITENLNKLGVPVPKFIVNALHSAEKKIEDLGENKEEEKNTKSKNT